MRVAQLARGEVLQHGERSPGMRGARLVAGDHAGHLVAGHGVSGRRDLRDDAPRPHPGLAPRPQVELDPGGVAADQREPLAIREGPDHLRKTKRKPAPSQRRDQAQLAARPLVERAIRIGSRQRDGIGFAAAVDEFDLRGVDVAREAVADLLHPPDVTNSACLPLEQVAERILGPGPSCARCVRLGRSPHLLDRGVRAGSRRWSGRRRRSARLRTVPALPPRGPARRPVSAGGCGAYPALRSSFNQS